MVLKLKTKFKRSIGMFNDKNIQSKQFVKISKNHYFVVKNSFIDIIKFILNLEWLKVWWKML